MSKLSAVRAALALLVVVATPAAAFIPWGGPGWYVFAYEDDFGAWAIDGPFTYERACRARLPYWISAHANDDRRDNDNFDLVCEYHIRDEGIFFD